MPERYNAFESALARHLAVPGLRPIRHEKVRRARLRRLGGAASPRQVGSVVVLNTCLFIVLLSNAREGGWGRGVPN
eukprot:COSAG02_NODE_5403_length_4357_cov_3.183185_9_plen_75_part_01